MTAPIVPFGANFSKTQSISVTSTTASCTLDATDVSSTPTPVSAGPSGGKAVMRLVNVGPNTCFVRWGVGVQTAVATDLPILVGVPELFTKSEDTNIVAAICASGQTATLYVTCGEGI